MKLALLALAAALALPSVALADVETDQSAGRCYTYLLVLGKKNAANLALSYADRRDRALQFARTEMNRATRMKEAGNWNASSQRVWAIELDGVCRRVGIRPGDYRN